MSEIVGEDYVLQQNIGHGSFGQIYIAEHRETGEKYAVKLENANISVPQLMFEARIYQIMAGSINVPRLYFQSEGIDHNVMVIDLMGKSIESLLNRCGRRLSIKTVCMLADQMIASVQYFHSKNYIHRDLKPDNFVMGRGKTANQLFIIDYGLAKRYRDQNTHKHIKFITGKSLTGTARYASINALAGCEQSRRDDIEDLAYVLIYLCKGTLPWMGIQARDRKEKYSKICNCKRSTPIEVLCGGLPQQFADFLLMSRALGFQEEPKYSKYRQLFRDLMIQNGDVFDYRYDWTILDENQPDDFVPVGRVFKKKEVNHNMAISTDDKLLSIEAVRSEERFENNTMDEMEQHEPPIHKVIKHVHKELDKSKTLDTFDMIKMRKKSGARTLDEDIIKVNDDLNIPKRKIRKTVKVKKRKSSKTRTLDDTVKNPETPKKMKRKRSKTIKAKRRPSVEIKKKISHVSRDEEKVYEEIQRHKEEEEQRRREEEEERRRREEEQRKREEEERRRREELYRIELEEERRREEEIRMQVEEKRKEEQQRKLSEARRSNADERRFREYQRDAKKSDSEQSRMREEERRRRKHKIKKKKSSVERRRAETDESDNERSYPHRKESNTSGHRDHQDRHSSSRFAAAPTSQRRHRSKSSETNQANVVDNFLKRVGAL